MRGYTLHKENTENNIFREMESRQKVHTSNMFVLHYFQYFVNLVYGGMVPGCILTIVI